jgi:tRNA A58 N-methylase Trm61
MPDNKDLISMRRSIQAKEYGGAVKTAEAMIEHGFVNIEATSSVRRHMKPYINPTRPSSTTMLRHL